MGSDKGKFHGIQMKGLLQKNINRNLPSALLAAAFGAFCVRTFYCNPKKRAFEEYYKTYDGDCHFERMRAAGLMQSARP